MSAEENKAVARRELEEIWNKGNLDAAEDVYAPDYIGHRLAGGKDIRGLEAIKQLAAATRQAFPDFNHTVEDMLAEGEKVVIRSTIHATHQGEFRGVAPTGKEVEVTSMTMNRIEGGKIAESWHNADHLGLMQQLGVIEQPSG
jgi:steroid delta-isomerase-like uncharacterized protein